MTLTFDALGGLDSWLGRRDPRWKLAALLIAAIVVASLRTLPTAAAALTAALALAVLGGLPCRWLLARLGIVALFLLPFGLLPLLPDASPGWTIGPLRVSPAGLGLALFLAAKALAMTALVLSLAATSSLPETLKAAQALRVPGLLVQLALLSYRYVFVLAGELARLRVALRVRGFRSGANLHSYRTIGHVAGILMLRSAERAERVGQAMRCRGFDGRFRSLTTFRTTAADVVLWAGVGAGAAGLAVWDWLPR
jgi:cobalt/nickel transport system permease protein